MSVPLLKKVSDYATNYLITRAFIKDPEIEPTAPPRIDREYRQFSEANIVADKLEKERREAILEGMARTEPLSKFSQIASGSVSIPLDPTRPGIRGGGYNEETTLSHNGLPIHVNTASMQGDRPSMEDEHIAKVFRIRHGNQTHTLSLFGVFDGHNGPEASAFVKQNIVRTLQYYLAREPLSDTAMFNALKLTFIDLDQRFVGMSGTCASMAIIVDGNLWVANTGDSRVVLDNDGLTEQLSRDAKPGKEPFIDRILKRLRDVWTASSDSKTLRVNGKLAVGGSIGDHTVRGTQGHGCISPRPKITKTPLAEIRKNSRLIIGCDGLWDVATSKEVVEAKRGAASLMKAAYRTGSTDNISVMTVDLSGIL